MNEWEFSGEVVSWINEYLQRNPSLPFFRAKIERTGQGSTKRRDITLLNKSKEAILTGEVKLPYAKDGNTPYNDSVVMDARLKAQKAISPFFFTWNVNEFVLWETVPDKLALQDQKYRSWQVIAIHKPSHLELSSNLKDIQSWIGNFLGEFSEILRGTASIGVRQPDEKFIDILESSLQLPIILNYEELLSQYSTLAFKRDLDKWMRDEQGWPILDDPQGISDNLERASKFSCYALVNKLVFHEALLKRYGSRMDSLKIPEHVDTGDKLRLHLEKYFLEAKSVTGDYETVFGEDHKSIGNRIPFYSDGAVSHWRQLTNQIHRFNFSKLDYEIIGSLFERLISPEERHKYGQFYTRVEIVDLINSFCIITGNEKIMDPACGGGTFLVRAYARKRELNPMRRHGQLLSDLFGVDISHYATHLTTINLATRDLVDEENYPQIARSDFFNIIFGKAFISLPKRVEAAGLGKIQHRNVEIPPLDAVVGNPPYVRQEDIPKAKKGDKRFSPWGTKEHYLKLIQSETGMKFSGRSDLHCYFWPHSASFIKEDGYICLLTSSQWLDVEYGFRLQDWILSNFRIIAVFESIDEPWFVGARVTTTVTILRRDQSDSNRMDNIIRFVQLRRPIKDILAYDGSTVGAINAADGFRDEILSLNKNTVNERFRARLVKQGDLWKAGVELGEIMRGVGEVDLDPDDDDSPIVAEFHANTDKYFGGKWGVYLRAPDLWFRLLDDHGHRLSPLGKLAGIRYGIKSGKDSFFFPIDSSADCLKTINDPVEFKQTYGVARKDVVSDKIKLVRCGEGRGEIRPIESCFLEPEVHSSLEIDSFSVRVKNCKRLCLLVGMNKLAIKGKFVSQYISWGEKQNLHKSATCAARVTAEREWYDLTGHSSAPILWSKGHQYRHVAPTNPDFLAANCAMYEIYPPEEYTDLDLWGGILNSTWALLSALQFGRPVGNEGNWSTMVVDVNMMLVPDIRLASTQQRQKISQAFIKMRERKALQFLSEYRLRQMSFLKSDRKAELDAISTKTELDMPDRRELDNAILETIGIQDMQQRKDMVEDLYAYVRDFFERTRQKEEKAIVNKNKTKRRSNGRPEDIAAQIHKEIIDNYPDLLLKYETNFLDKSKSFDTYDIPSEGNAEIYSDMLITQGVKFMKGAKTQLALIETADRSQSKLITLIANSGTRGLIRIPHKEDECIEIFDRYTEFINYRSSRIQELIMERVADEEIQEKVLDTLMPLLTND